MLVGGIHLTEIQDRLAGSVLCLLAKFVVALQCTFKQFHALFERQRSVALGILLEMLHAAIDEGLGD